ncbi:MAG: S9 family peptidase [Myxococcales bacterium]|nr:S9 family peptidase [Myxococcales bacterium]MCB9629970.1 S9 family peptidase [Sandaracinaceae bacterium]
MDVLHGVSVADPFRSLEVDSAETTRWVEAQNAYTLATLQPHVRPERGARLQELLSIDALGEPQLEGETLFFYRRAGSEEQGAYFVARGPAWAPDPEPVLRAEAFGERASIDYTYLSPGGRYVVFGVSQNGDERSTLRILDLSTRALLSDSITHAKWSRVSWLSDDTGFYYTRYPAEHDADFPHDDPARVDTYGSRVYRHRLGEPASADPLVFEAADPTDFPSVSVQADGEHLVLAVSRGWSANDLWLARRGPDDRPVEITPLIVGVEARSAAAVHGRDVLIVSNREAPRYRVLRTPLALGTPALADASTWQVLVPETDGVLNEWALQGDSLLLAYTEGLESSLRRVPLPAAPPEGGPLGPAASAVVDPPLVTSVEIPLPPGGELGELSTDRAGRHALFSFSGYRTPPVIMMLADGNEPNPVVRVTTDVDLEGFEYEVVQVPSADGTLVPLQLLYRRGMVRNSDNPTLLYGYGGFNVSLLPGFQRNLLYWLERGGVYAVANLRGGGELGEAWHRAGSRENKQRVFEDFEACIRYLRNSDISRPARIAITGGSNGGLLMGAMLTRVPEQVGAVVSYVGLYDMLRYHLFPPAEIWEPEYMSSESPEGFAVLSAYSPYHHVPEQVALPATLIETADHDSRVYWGHSTKFAARLQVSNTSGRPVLFYMEREQGHGAGRRLSDTVARYTRFYTFVEHALGMP